MKPGAGSAVGASAVSCYWGFDMHAALGEIGQVVGIISGIASLVWVAYQFYQSRKK